MPADVASAMALLASRLNHPTHDLGCVIFRLRVAEPERRRIFRVGEDVRDAERVATDRYRTREHVGRGKRGRPDTRRETESGNGNEKRFDRTEHGTSVYVIRRPGLRRTHTRSIHASFAQEGGSHMPR